MSNAHVFATISNGVAHLSAVCDFKVVLDPMKAAKMAAPVLLKRAQGRPESYKLEEILEIVWWLSEKYGSSCSDCVGPVSEHPYVMEILPVLAGAGQKALTFSNSYRLRPSKFAILVAYHSKVIGHDPNDFSDFIPEYLSKYGTEGVNKAKELITFSDALGSFHWIQKKYFGDIVWPKFNGLDWL